MSKGIIDVLPPYEEEFLTSWIVRMLRFYSCGRLNNYSSEIMKTLFGPNSSALPGLYLQRGLQYFVENCDIKDRDVFASEKDMLTHLSVVPFYLAFFYETQQKEFIKKYKEMNLYIRLETYMGIRSDKFYLEKNAFYKFCPKCLKEQQECYLYREHQIQGNLVCWKHHSVLHRVRYGLKWKEIDFVSNIEKGINTSTYDIPQKSIQTAIQISDMIHQIFVNGFLDSMDDLKWKIACRLYELGIITEQGTFFDLDNFARSLDADYLYDKLELERAVMCSISKEYAIHINPIVYIFIIRKLFGNLESYYSYVPIKPGDFFLSKSRVVMKRVEEKMHTIDYYAKKMSNDYAILGDTNDEIIVKHIPCESIYRFSKKFVNFRKCRYCKITNENSNSKIVFHCRYVKPREFSAIYGKKSKQVRNYCNNGRIEGVIRIGKDFLIPENAPYPKDKRKK